MVCAWGPELNGCTARTLGQRDNADLLHVAMQLMG